MLLGVGLIALIIADLVLALVPTVAGVLAVAAIWGVHMGLTQGLLSAWIADSAPDRLRGTAFGVFNLATGLTLFLASVLAGALWSMIGPAATFLAGAAFAVLALAGGLRLRTGASALSSATLDR